jgi:hypothetical protein
MDDHIGRQGAIVEARSDVPGGDHPDFTPANYLEWRTR